MERGSWPRAGMCLCPCIGGRVGDGFEAEQEDCVLSLLPPHVTQRHPTAGPLLGASRAIHAGYQHRWLEGDGRGWE